MSELKTNKIQTHDNNNVAIDNSLNLKTYTTTQRDALTSAAGDMIYNTTDSKIQVYNGSSWSDLGTTAFTTEFVVIAGGGAGGIYNTSGVTSNRYGGNGGSGIVVLRYPNTYTISQSGLTLTTATTGTDKVTTITAGTGTVSFS